MRNEVRGVFFLGGVLGYGRADSHLTAQSSDPHPIHDHPRPPIRHPPPESFTDGGPDGDPCSVVLMSRSNAMTLSSIPRGDVAPDSGASAWQAPYTHTHTHG